MANNRLQISKDDFVAWYERQDDRCAYCGLTFADLKRLQIKRGGGYCISWDIDRIDSRLPYQEGNLALSCFVCNMAKGDQLTEAEAKIVGRSIASVWRNRLDKLSITGS